MTAGATGLALTLSEAPQYIVPASASFKAVLPPQPYSAFPEKDGSISLIPVAAVLHGTQIRAIVEQNRDVIGYWSDPADYVSWTVLVFCAASYRVEAEYSTGDGPTAFDLILSNQRLTSGPVTTAGYQDYKTASFGIVRFPHAGRYEIIVRAHDPAVWKPLNIRTISLSPVMKK